MMSDLLAIGYFDVLVDQILGSIQRLIDSQELNSLKYFIEVATAPLIQVLSVNESLFSIIVKGCSVVIQRALPLNFREAMEVIVKELVPMFQIALQRGHGDLARQLMQGCMVAWVELFNVDKTSEATCSVSTHFIAFMTVVEANEMRLLPI
jgi:hypothetical protein